MRYGFVLLVGLSFVPSFGLSSTAFADDETDFRLKYPATLEHSPQMIGYSWTCESSDVWRLSKFSLVIDGKFEVETKSAQVVFGRHETNVLWAAIFPDEDGKIVRAPAGEGEKIASVWLRIHPARVAELFPASTIQGQGEAARIADARRLAAHKLSSSWHAGGRPVVPEDDVVTVDLETRQGSRRFFSVDLKKATVQYIDAFRNRPLPSPKAVDVATAEQVFDRVWKEFDREYAMFVVKPDVDWDALGKTFRARLAEAPDDQKLAILIAEMLTHLKDLHVYLTLNGVDVPTYDRERPLNANRRAATTLVGPLTKTETDLSWSVTDDGIGYIAVDSLINPELPKSFEEVLAKLDESRGLIIDLRANRGGNELLGRKMAAFFLDQSRPYAKSQVRNGPRHTDLTQPSERICDRHDTWRYVAPVVVLQGQRTISSAESFVQMLASAPEVTTIGDRTAGSSGNPRQLKAGLGIVVNVPRWNDLDLNDRPIDGVGIRPDVLVSAMAANFNGERDPVLSAALERLDSVEKLAGKAFHLRSGAVDPQMLPRVVSVSPANGARKVDPHTEIRVRFDRPMNPQVFNVQWKGAAGKNRSSDGFRMRGEIRYDTENNEFVFPVVLTPNFEHQLSIPAEEKEFQSYDPLFRSEENEASRAFAWKFTTRKSMTDDLGQGPQPARNDQSPKSAESLVELVHQIRQRRRELTSLKEEVIDRTLWTDQSRWFNQLVPPRQATFAFQGTGQFRTDSTGFFLPGVRLLVGGNEETCWSVIGKKFVTAPSPTIAIKNVLIADPFKCHSKQTDEQVVASLGLEHRGDEQYRDGICHRLRSTTKGAGGAGQSPQGLEWLIDPQSLLPVVVEYHGAQYWRYEFHHVQIDALLPAELFEPPQGTGLTPVDPEPLGDKYDRYFLNALDSSSGPMSVRWGMTGKGGRSSSGLN